jgi:Domain of Unknown Function (DUF1080)
MNRAVLALAIAAGPFLVSAPLPAGDTDGWIQLVGEDGLTSWRNPVGDWLQAGNAHPNPKNMSRLLPIEGKGVIVNGRSGKTTNLISKEDFGDIEAHFEFLIPKGSNSGVKFEGVYEIQIFDSHGKKKPTGGDSGGIYPRAEMLPRYHHIDDGTAPLVNAAKPFGEWQTLDVVFHTPRFDPSGKKIADARFERVVLNGKVVQENANVSHPTGHVWRSKEKPQGPILLQGDHGPVAFRNIRVRRLAQRSP